MSGVTVTFKIGAKKKRKPEKKPDTPPSVEKPGTRPVSRAARMLALAHYVERLVEEGSVRSYADAARQLGVSRARMSQILNLLNLPPKVQEGLLFGDLHLSERRVRALAASAEWEGKGIPRRDRGDSVLYLIRNHDDNACATVHVGLERREGSMRGGL